MAKVMIINGVWATLMCSMLAFTVVLYDTKPDQANGFGPYALDNPHIASILR
jgi:hypothetical protein